MVKKIVLDNGIEIEEYEEYLEVTGKRMCKACRGSGLYRGMGERGGAAVVCYKCKGEGYIEAPVRIDKFKGKTIDESVTRVYSYGGGYCITDKDVEREDGRIIRFSQFGCSYHDWLNGVEPIPIKDLMCPYTENNNGIGNEPLPECADNIGIGDSITKCKLFPQKHICWDKYEKL